MSWPAARCAARAHQSSELIFGSGRYLPAGTQRPLVMLRVGRPLQVIAVVVEQDGWQAAAGGINALALGVKQRATGERDANGNEVRFHGEEDFIVRKIE